MLSQYAEKYFNAYRLTAYDIKKITEENHLHEAEVLLYKFDAPSLSFYTSKIIPVAFGKKREIEFETDEKYKKYYIQSYDELKKFTLDNSDIIVISRERDIKDFVEGYKFKCSFKKSYRKINLYLCTK
jgi:4-amino-4-deoxy-L-arabinose transferase